MTAPTAIVADDEDHLRAHLKKMLRQHWPELVICAEAANGEEAAAALQKWQPDFAFLDIKMPVMSGLEVAQRNHGLSHIIFVTAYDEFAVAAFENNAVDYLLKPVSSKRLRMTIERAKSRLNQVPPNIDTLVEILSQQLSKPAGDATYLQWIKATRQDYINLIAIDEVDYFQSADKYTSVITRNGEWIIRTSLKELEKSLDPERFWRIHRGTIVRVQAIEQFSKTFSGHPILKLHGHKKPLPVSRSHAERFKAD
jgi:DNA-binding LytR/AlgR family response regulator